MRESLANLAPDNPQREAIQNRLQKMQQREVKRVEQQQERRMYHIFIT